MRQVQEMQAGRRKPAAPGASGEVKDTLIIGHYGDTPNFDTHDNLNDNGMRINMCVYDPLVRMDNETYENQTVSGRIMGDIGRRKRVYFAIKSGLSLPTEQTCQSTTLSSRWSEVWKCRWQFRALPVTGVEKVDDSHVKVILDGPYPEFLFAMALPTAGIFSKTAFESMGRGCI